MRTISDMDQINEIKQTVPRKTNLWLYVVLAAVIFAAFIAVGFIIPEETTTEVIVELQDTIKLLESLGPVSLIAVIFLNNAIKCLFVIVLGIIIGLPPVIFICFNAVTIGMLVAALGPEIGYGTIVASLLPHGIIEIPVLILSTAFGLSIGAEVWKFIIRQKSTVKDRLQYSLRIYARWLIVALLVAAIIEVFVTPLIVSTTGVSVPF